MSSSDNFIKKPRSLSPPFPSSPNSPNPASPSPSPSPGSPAPYSEFMEQMTSWEKFRRFIPETFSVGVAFCGVIAAYYAVKGLFIFASSFMVLGFILDAMSLPIAKVVQCNLIYHESLADAITFGLGGAEILLSYFQKNNLFWVGAVLAFIHVSAALSRLTLFLTEGTPPGYIRGLPAPITGVLISTVCAAGCPYKWIIGLTLISSFFMVSFDTIYIKPLSVKNNYVLAFVWLLYFLSSVCVWIFAERGNLVVASVVLLYGTIPSVIRFYRWLFKHSRYPGEFDYCITVGVYDMFHQGHYELFAHMSAMARKVLAGVHDDQSVLDLKKIHVSDKLEVRMANIQKLRRVRKVFPVRDTDPSDTIRKMLDYIPKGQTVCFMRGDDWQNFPGRPVLEERGIPIIFHHYTEGVSSSLLRLAREKHTI